MMTLFTKDGTPKLVPACSYPLTGAGCVDRVFSDFAIFDPSPAGVIVRASFGMSFDELAARLDVPLIEGRDRRTDAESLRLAFQVDGD